MTKKSDIVLELSNRVEVLNAEKKALNRELKRKLNLINDIYNLRDSINAFVNDNPRLNAYELKVTIEEGFSIDDLKDIYSQLNKEKDMLRIRYEIIKLLDSINCIISLNPELNIPFEEVFLEEEMKKRELNNILKKLKERKEIINLKINIIKLNSDISSLENKVDDPNYYEEIINKSNDEPEFVDSTYNDKEFYEFDYVDETKFRKLERALKLNYMLAYKKLYFDYYPCIKEGKFLGEVVKQIKHLGIDVYELVLPTDKMFAKIHGEFKLRYMVYNNRNLVVLDTIDPENFLLDGHLSKLTTYKGVMISKENASKDMFKIDLLSMLNDDK